MTLPNPNPTPPNPDPNPNPNPTPPDERQKEIDRLLAENSSLRKVTKDNETKLSTLEQTVKSLQTAGHKTAGDWQKVAESQEAEAKQWKEKFEKANTAFVTTQKMGKVKEEALKLGLLPEAVNDLDALEFEEVAVAIDSNNQFRVSGADVAARNLKVIRPHWFKNATPPNFNPGGNGNPPPPGAPKKLDELKAAYQTALRGGKQSEIKPALEAYNSALLESRKKKPA